MRRSKLLKRHFVGYEDPNSFYRAFRSWEGKTPAEWRAANERRKSKRGAETSAHSPPLVWAALTHRPDENTSYQHPPHLSRMV